jgi:hypothetical protein
MKNNTIALEGGRVSWMTVTSVNYCNSTDTNKYYKKYERKIGDSSFTCSHLEGDEWIADKRKINWYDVYQKVETDKKDPRFNRDFGIEIK